MTVLVIVLGAAVGAPLRYLLDRWITGRTAPGADARRFGEVPWGLFTVNVLGSAVAGVALASTSGVVRTLLVTGLCGTFTTFSGFSWEGRRLWSTQRTSAWVTIIGMPIACLAAFLVAQQAARAIGALLG